MKVLALAMLALLLGGCVTVRCDCRCHETAAVVESKPDNEKKSDERPILPRPRKWD